MFRFAFLLLFFSLTACVSPVRLGISEAEWRNYSPEEKQSIKKGYYAVLKQHFRESNKAVPDGTNLKVVILGGQASMPPFNGLCNFVPMQFTIGSGECDSVELKEQ